MTAGSSAIAAALSRSIFSRTRGLLISRSLDTSCTSGSAAIACWNLPAQS